MTDPHLESESEATVDVNTNVRVEHYTPPEREDWTDLPKQERIQHLQAGADPKHVGECHNVTCIGLHEYIPALLNFHNDFELVADQPDRIAFGNSNTTPQSSNRSLNSRVGAVTLTDPSNSGTEWSCTELVGALELNNLDLYEVGVESDSGTLYNHTLLPNPLTPKTSSDELIITVNWTFSAP